MSRRKWVGVGDQIWLCDELGDKYLYDTQMIRPAIQNLIVFQSVLNKGSHLARFAGDRSLVAQGRLFQIYAAYIKLLGPAVPDPQQKAIFDFAFLEMKVNQYVVDKDALHRWMGGLDTRKAIGGGNVDPAMYGTPGDGTMDSARAYNIPISVPGGQNYDLQYFWPNPGGLVLPAGTVIALQTTLVGMECIPVSPQPQFSQDEGKDMAEKQRLFRQQVEQGGY